jgi:predicted nucleic acid-binding protein
MPQGLFVDTGFFLALVNTRDEYHERAAEYSRRTPGRLFTTDAVLTEVANALSGVQRRSLAAALVESVRQDSQFTVVSVSTKLFDDALVLYSS